MEDLDHDRRVNRSPLDGGGDVPLDQMDAIG
jgi:hypothetical protein